jgi:photosystem II stability/assembly factor-like uncharacterized protein
MHAACLAAGIVLSFSMQLQACAAQLPGALERPAAVTKLASRSAMVGLARAGARIVAVGERGIVLLSDDAGLTWRQGRVPVSVTLTSVNFPTPRQGWAVGHAGVILHTADAGETWALQLDGKAAAAAILKQAEASPASEERGLAHARQMATDGPDKPFLDVYFPDAKTGFAVGAFGLFFGTHDAGQTWQSLQPLLDNPRGLHLYALKGNGASMLVVGEQGFAARSADGGNSFSRIDLPYNGSLFAAALLPAGGAVVAGLKGNLYHAASLGGEYRHAASNAHASLNALTTLRDGRLVAANQAGQLLVSDEDGNSFQPVRGVTTGGPLSAVLQAPDESIICAGMRGLVRVPLASLPPIRK